MAIKKKKSNSDFAFPSATAELVVEHYNDLFRSDPDFVTREKVFDSVRDNRKAGLDLFRVYCLPETVLAGEEGSLSAREEMEFSSLSPVFLSAFGIDFSSDVTPEDDVLDLLLSVVPDPVVPDVIRQCLEEDGIPLGNNSSGERIRISVASLGEGAVQRLLEANADAFIRNLSVEAYRNAMWFLSVEAEGDAYCKVFRKLFADESNARREALLVYFYSVRSTFPEDSIVKRLGFSATAFSTVNDWLKSVVGDQPYFMSPAVFRDYGIESLERKSVMNMENFNNNPSHSAPQVLSDFPLNGETYALANDITMFMVNKLNEHGIKTVMVSEEEAHEILEKERGSEREGLERIDFSVRDIMNLSYTWNGEEVSMRGFAEQFMSEIKQKDRTMEDAERIAKAFIDAVKADPEKAGMKMLKAENMANAFRFKLPDGTVYTPEHPLASSPEYETQKGLWLIYEDVLGRETMNEFVGLLSKNAPMSVEERKRFTELESKVNGSALMQRSLEVPASKVNENRVRDIRNLIQYFEGNEDYTWTEKALIVKGAMSFGYSEKKESDQTKVEIKNISDNNSVAVPVIGGDAAAVVEGLRKGLNFKDALIQARISLSKESKRSVARNFTGWKVYKQSNKEEDAVILNQDVAGTGWCTGGAVSTARSHLSGGDFHVYYEAGEPLIAIRTENGRMAEPPRGAHEGQFCTDREEQIAFDYIRSGNGIVAGNAYIADIEDIRRIMSPNATPLDAFMMPDERRYENGEFGGDTSAWGKSVEQRIAELIPDKEEERWKLGLYYGYEIEDACKNGNVIAIKGSVRNGDAIVIVDPVSLILPKGVTQVGDIELYGSASLTLSAGVTQVGLIYLYNSASLTLSEGVTQVEGIVLWDSTSMTIPKGVTQVGNIDLHDSTSLTIPEGVTQVGNIYLYGSSSLTLPKGVTQLRDIYLRDSTSMTIPKGVTQVRDIKLCDSVSLTFPEGVTWVGNIDLRDSASLTLPEGVKQVGNIHLSPGSSITFPDGFVLRNESHDSMHYSSEKINEILSEHQKKTEFHLSDGTVYGYQIGETIYLTPKGVNPNTPIHEYAHLWAKVFEKLRPDEWESLKEELKVLPQWKEIAESESYSFIESDENRLAGEVLATIVGNKGEELMLSAARDTLKEGERTDESVAKGAEYFRRKVTDMAVKDVFDAEGLERAGEVTLKVLKDFAEGKGFKMSKEEGERLVAMAESERNRVIQRQIEASVDPSYFPKSVFINYSDGRKKPFVLGEFNVKDTVLLVSAMQQELNSRSLFFVNVTPDKVGDFMDVLKKHSLDQVFDVRLSSANNTPFLSVNGVNYLVPEEGIYFVYNRDYVSGVYRRDAFETLFKVEPNGVRCTPVRNLTGMNNTTGLSRKKSGLILN